MNLPRAEIAERRADAAGAARDHWREHGRELPKSVNAPRKWSP
jgi:hypothetical protein